MFEHALIIGWRYVSPSNIMNVQVQKTSFLENAAAEIFVMLVQRRLHGGYATICILHRRLIGFIC